MKKFLIITAIGAVFFALCLLIDRFSFQTKGLFIKNVTIVSPEYDIPLKRGYIKIRGNRIESVGEWSESIRTEGYDVYDASDKYIIPGLIDAHVHLSAIPGVTEAVYDKLSEVSRDALNKVIAEYKRQLPRSYLYFGYTTLVDLNVTDRKFMEEISEAPAHPDIFDCDGALMVANGYPMLFSPPEKRFIFYKNFLYDPSQSDKIPSEYKPDDHSPAAAVRRVKEAAGICIKIFYEDGFGPNDSWPVPTLEMMQEVVRKSAYYNLPTLIHANSYNSQKISVDAGVDIIAHGMWNWNEYSAEEVLPDQVKSVLNRIVTSNMAYMPTYMTLVGLQNMYSPDFLKLRQLTNVLPSGMLSWIMSDEGGLFADSLLEEENMDLEQMYRSFEKPFQRLDQIVKYLYDAGGKFVFGTDTPASPTFGNPPGLNGMLEMERWYKAGISLSDILKAATITAAEELHLDSEYGTIEPGKIANLVIMNKNPLETIDAYDSIDSIVIHGRLHPRNTFSAIPFL